MFQFKKLESKHVGPCMSKSPYTHQGSYAHLLGGELYLSCLTLLENKTNTCLLSDSTCLEQDNSQRYLMAIWWISPMVRRLIICTTKFSAFLQSCSELLSQKSKVASSKKLSNWSSSSSMYVQSTLYKCYTFEC